MQKSLISNRQNFLFLKLIKYSKIFWTNIRILSRYRNDENGLLTLREDHPVLSATDERSGQREWGEEWETVGRKRHDRTMPAYDNYTSTGQLHPYTAVIRTIPGAADPVCLAARLDSTRVDLTWCGSTVTDESLSVLSPDWHTRGTYHRTKAGTVSPRHDFLSLKCNWRVNWIFIHIRRCVHKQFRPNGGNICEYISFLV